jgi:hypothetical protein
MTSSTKHESSVPKDISQLLSELYSVQGKHIRKGIMRELGNAKNPIVISDLVKVARGEIPGDWFESWHTTMNELNM